MERVRSIRCGERRCVTRGLGRGPADVPCVRWVPGEHNEVPGSDIIVSSPNYLARASGAVWGSAWSGCTSASSARAFVSTICCALLFGSATAFTATGAYGGGLSTKNRRRPLNSCETPNRLDHSSPCLPPLAWPARGASALAGYLLVSIAPRPAASDRDSPGVPRRLSLPRSNRRLAGPNSWTATSGVLGPGSDRRAAC